MRATRWLRRTWPLALLLAAVALAAPAAGTASAAPPRQTPPDGRPTLDADEFCLACHETPGRLLRLPSGEWLGLTPDRANLEASVHADTSCAGCHARQSTLPHRSTPESRRDLILTVSASCAQCHDEQHEGYEDGIHGVSQDLGLSRAATCVDCHGGHAVRPIAQWTEEERAQRCGACHQGADPAFALAGVGHQEEQLATLIERFLVILTALVLGFGVLHVELDLLRWSAEKWRGRDKGRTE